MPFAYHDGQGRDRLGNQVEEISQSVVGEVMGATTVHEDDDVVALDVAEAGWPDNVWRLSWVGLWSIGGGDGKWAQKGQGGQVVRHHHLPQRKLEGRT